MYNIITVVMCMYCKVLLLAQCSKNNPRLFHMVSWCHGVIDKEVETKDGLFQPKIDCTVTNRRRQNILNRPRSESYETKLSD